MIVDTEREGRKYKVQVPDGAPEAMWPAGIIIGPPDLSSLNLDYETETRLHNELFNRGLITLRDTRKRIQEIQAALQAAFRVDAGTIMEAYQNAGRSK